ncbi:MAG: hypothetical protein FJ398_00520 [Verrucomicrobia bacterium]|nr:hypothetical protein [Verrucomicrobiota bacterium]
MIEWNIQSRAHACQACHKPFADKEPFHTLLFDHKSAYERLDVCENCWSTQYSQGATDRKGFISYWQSIYTVPPAAPPDPIQKETAESLLRKLIEQNDPSHAAARFILAVMLERKRLLKVKAQLLEHQQRIFVYEHAGTGDLFQIPDPNLKLDKLEEVQREVARLLEHGVNPRAPAASGTEAQKESGSGPGGTENKTDGSQSTEESIAVAQSSTV